MKTDLQAWIAAVWMAGLLAGCGGGESSPDPCADDVACAQANRECFNDQGTATCGACLAGYHEDAASACVPDQACGPDSCSGHGLCSDTGGVVTCACEAEYAGDHCEGCAPGFEDYGDGICRPSDPCADDTACAAAARTCVNQQGTAVCGACLAGYHEDAAGTCVPDQACGPDSCSGHGLCSDTGGVVTCACEAEYAGDHCEGCAPGFEDYGDGICRPSDPCVDDVACAQANRECFNDQGTATCGACLAGYHEDAAGTCVPDQACGPDSCSGHGSCDDTGGVVVCNCTDGFSGADCSVCTGCEIAGGCHADGMIEPGNPCRSCQVAVAPDAWTALSDGTPCADGDACNGDETCQFGACEAGAALDCDDHNVCTDDGCDAATGCEWPFNLAGCDDGDAQTTDDTCDGAGACVGLADVDADGVADYGYSAACPNGQTDQCNDNCIGVANPAQADSDGDLVGDTCDLDVVPNQYINSHVWSPDGSRIAFTLCPPNQGWSCDLVVADPALTSGLIINQDVPASGLADWQGPWILFHKWTSDGLPPGYRGDGEVWKVRFDGNSLTQVTFTQTNGIKTNFVNPGYTNIGTVRWARFVPGTGKVYFHAHNGNGWYSTYTCNDDGTDGWQRISPDRRGWDLAYSPLGDRLLYGDAGDFNLPREVTAVDVNGTNPLLVLPGQPYTYEYVVSPDGATLAYARPGARGDALRLVDLDGTDDRLLIEGTPTGTAIHRLEGFHDGGQRRSTGSHWYPWSPNGLQLLFGSNLAGDFQVFLINADGSGLSQVSSGASWNWEAKFSPDGYRISYLSLPTSTDLGVWPWPTRLVVQSTPQLYDDFEDGALDGNKWTKEEYLGGRVYERGGLAEVRGYADSGQTGTSVLISTAAHPYWEFTFDMLNQGGPGCQGWTIGAFDASAGLEVIFLDNWSDPASCSPGFTDPGGHYQVSLVGGLLRVTRDGALVREVNAQGLGDFQLRFVANNMWGSGHHTHIFLHQVLFSP